ncbi:MAG: hypothetical protein CMP48_16980 [Rickettsiales bacterium]|nr:hypothetical protein [Rickettsiales bacterium]
MIIKKPILGILLTLFIVFIVKAQDKIKFGKVSDDLLEMEYYERDSTAEAVILSDIGHYDKVSFNFYRHLRVKILKTSGTKWGNWTFNVPSKGNIEGWVYNLENGEVVKEKLRNSSIYEEELVEDYIVYKVFMPNIKVGSVFEIRYSIPTVPFEWRFQEEIPVVYSELKLDQSEYLNYSINSVGFAPIETVEWGRHWIARDMPAFEKEPYMRHYSNYITKFEIELKSVQIPGVLYRTYTTSWERVGGYFDNNEYVGGVFRNSMFLNEFAKSVKDLDISMEEKIDTAYNYIKDNIKWNGNVTLYANNDYRKGFLTEHSGNSAEINLLLTSLLMKMDLPAAAVLLSTRSNGVLNPRIPSINKLDYVLAMVKTEEGSILLDATDDDLQPGYIAERSINGRGRWFDKDYTGWVDLDPKGPILKSSYLINVKQLDGEYKATIQSKFSDYSYLRWKDDFEEEGSEAAYTASIESDFPGMIVEEYSNEIDKEGMNASESLEVDITELVDDLGDEVYLPTIFVKELKNPFNKPDRKNPIDFTLPITEQYFMTYELEGGYVVSSMPESVRFALPEDGGDFLFICNAVGNKIQVQCKINIKKAYFLETQYPFIQSFYTEMINKLTESIQINKT